MDLTSAAADALVEMREWQWRLYDPDGVGYDPAKDLSDVISRLAMEGHSRPQFSVLELLCSGLMIAHGTYKWRKYEAGERYEREEYRALIHRRNWLRLFQHITDEANEIADEAWTAPSFDLPMLEMKMVARYDWAFTDNAFQTATRPPETHVFDQGYFEEWFSAWEISLHLSALQAENGLHLSALQPANSAGGRPPANWWPDFAEELAVYIHENGLPDGQGHDGQSVVIDAIFRKLSERGKPEPGRATVQPVVNAVLSRIRSAEN